MVGHLIRVKPLERCWAQVRTKYMLTSAAAAAVTVGLSSRLMLVPHLARSGGAAWTDGRLFEPHPMTQTMVRVTPESLCVRNL